MCIYTLAGVRWGPVRLGPPGRAAGGIVSIRVQLGDWVCPGEPGYVFKAGGVYTENGGVRVSLA